MANIKTALMLAGGNGLSFFLQEALIGYGLVNHVDSVSSAAAAIERIGESEPYSLIIIDLDESWEQGMELGVWLKQETISCPIILITSSSPADPPPSLGAPFIVLPAPITLQDFITTVRAAFQEEVVS